MDDDREMTPGARMEWRRARGLCVTCGVREPPRDLQTGRLDAECAGCAKKSYDKAEAARKAKGKTR
jgi:hypothetical protein